MEKAADFFPSGCCSCTFTVIPQEQHEQPIPSYNREVQYVS